MMAQLLLAACSSDMSNAKPDPINANTKRCPAGQILVCTSRGSGTRTGQDSAEYDICICEQQRF